MASRAIATHYPRLCRLRLIHLLVFLVASQMDKVYIKAKGKEKVVWEEHWKTDVYAGSGENRHKVGEKHHEKEYDEKESFFKYKPVSRFFCRALVQLKRGTFHSYGLDAHACVLLCVVSTGTYH